MDNDDDQFPSGSNLCHVSSSQEEELKKCGFALEDSDSDTPLFGSDPVDTPIESTEIFMVSPPESPSSQTEVFRTPPEESTLSTPRAVDLGRDTEEFTERIGEGDLCESAVKRLKLVEESAEGDTSSVATVDCVERIAKSMTKLNSPLKLFGVLAGESGLKDARGSVGEEGDGTSNVGTFVEKLNCEKNSCNGGQETPEVEAMGTEGLCDDDYESRKACKTVEIENAVGDGDKEIHQETPARRKLEFSTEVVESLDGGSNVDSGVERTSNGEEVGNAKLVIKSIDEIEKFRYVRPGNLNANEKDKDQRGKRMLPASILENAGEIEKKAHHDQNAASINEDTRKIDDNSKDDQESWEFLKGVLKMLSRRSNSSYAPNLENMNILEVAKMCGITFP